VPPGQEGKITLNIQHTEAYSGEVSKQATVTTNDPKLGSFSLTLKGYFRMDPVPGATGIPAAVAIPPAAKKIGPFRAVPDDQLVTAAIRGSSVTNSINFINQAVKPVHVTRVVPGGDTFSVKLRTVDEGKQYYLSVTSNPDLKAGKYNQTVTLYTDSAETPEIPVKLELNVFALVIATPNTINLPRFPLSGDVSKMFVPVVYVRKIRDGGLKVNSVSSSLPFLKVDVTKQVEGEQYTLHLTLDKSQIQAPGEFHGKIRVETNDAETPVLEIQVNAWFT